MCFYLFIYIIFYFFTSRFLCRYWTYCTESPTDVNLDIWFCLSHLMPWCLKYNHDLSFCCHSVWSCFCNSLFQREKKNNLIFKIFLVLIKIFIWTMTRQFMGPSNICFSPLVVMRYRVCVCRPVVASNPIITWGNPLPRSSLACRSTCAGTSRHIADRLGKWKKPPNNPSSTWMCFKQNRAASAGELLMSPGADGLCVFLTSSGREREAIL